MRSSRFPPWLVVLLAAVLVALTLRAASAQPERRPPRPQPAAWVADTLPARATVVRMVRLTAFRPVRVLAIGEPPQELGCRVLDAAGEAVATGCRVAWTPARTGAYRLELRNHGDRPLPYRLLLP